jgi:hypothetical protein
MKKYTKVDINICKNELIEQTEESATIAIISDLKEQDILATVWFFDEPPEKRYTIMYVSDELDYGTYEKLNNIIKSSIDSYVY